MNKLEMMKSQTIRQIERCISHRNNNLLTDSECLSAIYPIIEGWKKTNDAIDALKAHDPSIDLNWTQT